ncbi:Myb-like DNA-binding domain containing protein [Trichomonas vaginalis G3]|uniref:Myb-like DNA-binding domain containing protein n=1 Tax=Trichomonas vaginalis (strain ATCC PRA-98 / G3) TaxID=412133 RepID=A2D7Q6_TRIV3|nr:RNA polymerase II transcription regulator recruiting protein [Trichomonas vaginalis G3]EAY23773.1 Myb-like DNA-binding domain containing protein [Trichomonas vaginalis G3]KAI5490286.1 RNA polymerase II transcription regulator recruiting protein [Trichomonas vaginalis G3]|eukprot:XP_001277021.1 Myb-like DNA-binding domain containing protein [Trichomonas vaginalis G3]
MSDSSDYYSYGSTDDESGYSSSSYSIRGKYGKRFTKEEDNLLKELAKDKRNKTWKDIAEYLPGRTARQCRDRYNQYLFKDVVKKPWTDEEDMIIVEKYKLYGPHWVKISHFLPGRSGNNIKNRWHNALTKFHGIQHKNPRQERRSKKEKWTEENAQPEECEVIQSVVNNNCQKAYESLADIFQQFDESIFNDFGEFHIF